MTEMSLENRDGSAGRSAGPQLDAFVPALIRQRLARYPSTPTKPDAEWFPAALLMADVRGFTALAETCARRGPRGAEDLKDLLNLFFGRLVDLVHTYGGQILRFPGDATLALWPSEGEASVAARHAAHCALEAQQALRQILVPGGMRLDVRAGIGVGDVWAAYVGGIAGRWELLVAGDPLHQATHSMSVAGSGEVAVSSAVYERISHSARTDRLAKGVYRLGSIEACPLPLTPPPVELGPDAARLLRVYVPRSVQARLDAGQTGWLGEFRRVCVLFIKLGVLDVHRRDALDRLQSAVSAVQTSVYRYGGSINQILADDKGTVVVCAWGLALHAHADDEVRALRAAVELRRELSELELGGSFGVATGEVFTGLRGNHQRCEYGMIGDIVNIAARLMEAADGDILCDSTSYEGAARRIDFDELPSLKVKGRDRPVARYRPVQLSVSGSSEIVGRLRERRALHERLDALVSGSHGGVVVVEGDAGIGKSRLVADLIEKAVARGVRAMAAAGDAIERSAPYHVWRVLLDNLLGLEQIAGRGGAERRVLDLLESNARLLPFAPLLNPVLRLNFRETEQSARVPPRGRAVLTRELLLHLLRSTTRGQPTLLVLEDAHWFDSGSWALAEAVGREHGEILLLITMRPVSQEEKPTEFLRLSELAFTLRLDVLTAEETRALACQRLRARSISEPVARLIRDKAEGHPFFTEELVYALRDRGLVRVEEGICRLTAAGAASDSVQQPSTVQVVIGSRIDQLTVSQQLTLKVASVFGRTFDLAAVRAAYPIEIDPEELRAHVDALSERHLVHLSSLEPAPTYSFKHSITQEVAYSFLPFALRRQLHSAAASWYERQHPDDLAPFYPLLAYHWSQAEVAEQALFYLERAGEQALGRHASEEALRFYNDALEICGKFGHALSVGAPVVLGRRHTIAGTDARRLRWERRLGDACMNLGRWEEGRDHFNRALTLMGQPLPDSDRRFATGLASQVLNQCARRLLPRAVGRASSEATELIREAVCAYERIGSISYHYDRPIPVVYALITGLNLAERLGPSLELALVYADFSNVLGLVPLHRIATAYQAMARRTVTRLDNPSASTRVFARAAVYRLGIGDWSACEDLDAEMRLCEQVGDSYQWAVSAAVRARSAHLRGEFELAATLAPEIRNRAALHGSSVHEMWGLDCEIWSQLFLGRHDTLSDLIDAGLRLLTTSGRTERLPMLDLLGAKALVHLYRGELDGAERAAGQLLEILSSSPRPGYFAALCLSAAAEAYLAIWETHGAAHTNARSQALAACRHLDRYSRISPPARARALLWRACAEWLEGSEESAHATFRGCLREAERYALPYETARAHFEIGRRLSVLNPERNRHLALAEDGFLRMKAGMEAARVAAVAAAS